MVENDLPIGAPLLSILAIADSTFTQPELCFDQLQFIFATQTLILSAIADTDEIKLSQTVTVQGGDQGGDVPSPDWARSLLGQKLQTLWTCENAQGYQDQIVLAFGQLHPSVTILAEGSVLKVFQNQPLQKHPLPAIPRQTIPAMAIADRTLS